MDQIVSLLFFYKDSFGINYPSKIDMSLSKETKPKKNHIMVIKNL